MNPRRRVSPALGQPIILEYKVPHFMRCCNPKCRLAHLLIVEQISKKRVQLRFYLDEYETAKAKYETARARRERRKKSK